MKVHGLRKFHERCTCRDLFVTLLIWRDFFGMSVYIENIQVFQRRQDRKVDFYRGWTEYVKGFGDVKTEFWIECCYGYILSTDRSRCEDCPAGLYGNSCLYKCPYGQYGVRCNSKCPKTCSGKLTCDRVEGCQLKNIFRKANVTTTERKERSTQYSTESQTTKRPSTAIAEGTLDINTEVLYRSQKREEKTRVVYVIYSSCGSLAFACILLFIVGMVFVFKRMGSSKIVPFYNADQIIYDEIPEDLIPSDVTVKRPVVSPLKFGYYNDNTDVLLSKQHSGNLEDSEPPPYYNDQKEYDYAYQKNNDYYLNPYNTLQTTGYSDHLYHDLKG
ncbi:unnamed protein product [Mytilus coruscus]|uniref:Fibrinogen C-terminal domain-containing protein n=1 Tax=Mytilus coruscus TaxID=42192 RepID=A0A6J8D9T5_MYTCO|nr:unnamed protein product [Mytilus coruscus]